MANYQAEYRRKLIPAEEAAGLVRSGMWLDYGYACGFPLLIDEKLARRAGELEKVKVRVFRSLAEPQILKADPRQEHFIYSSWQISPAELKYHDLGCCAYIPSNLGEVPRLYREQLKDEVDMAFITVTPVDEHGYFNFGAAVSYEKAVCDVAKTVVVEVNESQPWVYGGHDEGVHISQVTHIVENDKYEIVAPPVASMTSTDEAIAQHIAGLIENGATIQLGIGSIPNSVGRALIKQGLQDLGIHTGVFVDSMVDLMESGVVNNRKKSLVPGKSVLGSAIGSRRLYDYIHRNTAVAGFPFDFTHSLSVVARIKSFIAINSALKVDLKGQVCSESIGMRQLSGTGGQLEWTRGAYLSPGGKAFICLHATRRSRDGKLLSNIMYALEPGDTVTVPAADMGYVVTEFGAVNLKGKTTWQRAKLLLSIAHPDFRDELEEIARRGNLITRGV